MLAKVLMPEMKGPAAGMGQIQGLVHPAATTEVMGKSPLVVVEAMPVGMLVLVPKTTMCLLELHLLLARKVLMMRMAAAKDCGRKPEFEPTTSCRVRTLKCLFISSL